MKMFMPIATYVLVGIIGVWLDLREPIINRPLYLRDATLGRIFGTVLLWPLRVLLHDNVLLWIASAIFIVWISFLSRQSPFLAVVVGTMLGGLIYALWGRNAKQMIRLYPEEKDSPLPSRIFLRAYRVFMLIVIPGLPIYFITLKLIGVINWSWWWVLSPSLLIYAPFLFFCMFGGIWVTYRQVRVSKEPSEDEQDSAGDDPNESKCGWDSNMKWEITGGPHHHCSVGRPDDVKDSTSTLVKLDKEQIQEALAKGQHYVFVHEVLRDLFFDQPENIVAILRAKGANDSLMDLWHRVGKEIEGVGLSSPDGLGCEVRTLDNDTAAVLITIPPPQRICEAYFAVMVYRPASAKHEEIARFIVLERGVSEPRLCEWEDGVEHCNMGYHCEPKLESFFEAVREAVSCDSLI